VANGKATIVFYGNAISLHGSTSDLHGLYAVSLDGGPQQTYYGDIDRPNTYRPQQLLYLANNLPPGPHQLELINLEEGKILDFDFANITTYVDHGVAAPISNTSPGPSTTSTPRPSPEASTHHATSIAAIAGGAVGGVAVLVLLSIILCLFLRRHRRHREGDQSKAEMKNKHPALGSEFASGANGATTASYSAFQGADSHTDSGGAPGAVMYGESHLPQSPRGKRDMYAQQRNIASGGGGVGVKSTPTAVVQPSSNGGSMSTERIEEEDMPPPNYTRVFPRPLPAPGPVRPSAMATPVRIPSLSPSHTSDHTNLNLL
jgi:hypothetical protein